MTPGEATLLGSILSNSVREMDTALLHVIEVRLRPAGLLTIARLNLGVRSWRQLEGRCFEFSTEPRRRFDEGEIVERYEVDGALQLGEGLELRRVTRVELGSFANDVLSATVELAEEPEPLQLDLSLGPVTVYGDMGLCDPPGASAAAELAACFLDLDDYELELDGELVQLHPRF